MKTFLRYMPFFLAFAAGSGLSAFTRNVNVAEAIGFSVIITGTVLFIFALLTLAVFGAFILWRILGQGADSINWAFERAGLTKESR